MSSNCCACGKGSTQGPVQHECRRCKQKLHSICAANFGQCDEEEGKGYVCPRCSKCPAGEGSAAAASKRGAGSPAGSPARPQRRGDQRARRLPGPPVPERRANSSALSTPQRVRVAGNHAAALQRRRQQPQRPRPQPAPVRMLTTPQRARVVVQHAAAKVRRDRSRRRDSSVAHILAGNVSDSSNSNSSPGSPGPGPATPVASRLRRRAAAPDSPSKGANKRGRQSAGPDAGPDTSEDEEQASPGAGAALKKRTHKGAGRPKGTASSVPTHGQRRRCACGAADCYIGALREAVRVTAEDVPAFHAAVAPSAHVLAWNQAAGRQALYLLKRHWPKPAFVVTSRTVSLRRNPNDGTACTLPSATYQMSPGQLSSLFYQQQTGTNGTHVPAGFWGCPCWSSQCPEELNLRECAKTKAPPDQLNRDAWCKALMPASSGESAEHKEARIKFRDLSRTVYVNLAHFAAEDLHRVGRYDSAKPGAVPTLNPRSHVDGSPGDETASASEGDGLDQAGQDRDAIMEVVLEALGAVESSPWGDGDELYAAASQIAANLAEEGLGFATGEDNVSAPEPEPPRLKAAFLEMLRTNPTLCLYYTGEVGWSAIEGLFEWMNADGAFDSIRMVADPEGDSTGQLPRVRPGRKKAGTPLEQFVFWLCVFRRFKSHMQHAGALFDVSEATAHRWYRAWTNSVARFSRAMFPPELLTHEKMVQATSATTLDRLKMKKGEGVILGDCTERWVDDVKSRAVHKTFYSEYKNHPTVMNLVLADGSSYIWWTVEPFCGA